MEESLSNYNQLTSIIFTNLPKRILGLEIDKYIKNNIEAAYSNCVDTIDEYKKRKETIQNPNFIPPTPASLQQVDKILYRQDRNRYNREVVIQFADPHVTRWLTTMYECEVFSSQDDRQLTTVKYPEHLYVIMDRLKEF